MGFLESILGGYNPQQQSLGLPSNPFLGSGLFSGGLAQRQTGVPAWESLSQAQQKCSELRPWDRPITFLQSLREEIDEWLSL